LGGEDRRGKWRSEGVKCLPFPSVLLGERERERVGKVCDMNGGREGVQVYKEIKAGLTGVIKLNMWGHSAT
jgi:hypothetical protein